MTECSHCGTQVDIVLRSTECCADCMDAMRAKDFAYQAVENAKRELDRAREHLRVCMEAWETRRWET